MIGISLVGHLLVTQRKGVKKALYNFYSSAVFKAKLILVSGTWRLTLKLTEATGSRDLKANGFEVADLLHSLQIFIFSVYSFRKVLKPGFISGVIEMITWLNRIKFHLGRQKLTEIMLDVSKIGQEPWSGGYGRLLMFERSWFQILPLNTGCTWLFLHLFVVKIVLFVWKRPKINERRLGLAHFIKKTHQQNKTTNY